MFLFSFLLFPAVILYRCVSIYKNEGGFNAVKNKFLVMITGSLCGILLCSMLEFFFFLGEYNGLNIAAYSFFKWFIIFVIPALFYIFYILWSNDQWQVRIENYQYFMLPFLAFFVPYIIFTDSFDTSSFMLFIFPVLYLMLILAVRVEIVRFYQAMIQKKPAMILFALLILVESLIPAIIEGMWHFDVMAVIWLVISVLFCLFCAVRGRIEVKSMIETLRS